MTPKKIYISKHTTFNENNVSEMTFWRKRFLDIDVTYILEAEHNKAIESWKEEEKIWIKQLAEKDAEIERLKEELKNRPTLNDNRNDKFVYYKTNETL